MKLLQVSPTAFGDIKLIPLERLQEKANKLAIGKEDFLVPLTDVKFVGLNLMEVKSHGRLLVTELAFYQLCGLLKLPFDYMMRCPLDLRNENLAYWIDQADDRKVFFRTRSVDSDPEGSILRAVLPRTYEPIDNSRILDWCDGVLTHFGGALGIQFFKISEVSTHIRMLFSEPSVVDSDEHYFGVHVGDSEVGERALTASFTDYRVSTENTCLHKVDGKHLVNQRHIHIDFKSLRRAFEEGFEIAKEQKDAVLDTLRYAQAAAITDAPNFIRKMIRHYRLTNEFAEAVVTAYESEPNPTKYGVVQALTRAARRMPIDAQIDVELMAGEFLGTA
jgi:hypothetical protein